MEDITAHPMHFQKDYVSGVYKNIKGAYKMGLDIYLYKIVNNSQQPNGYSRGLVSPMLTRPRLETNGYAYRKEEVKLTQGAIPRRA